MRNLNRPGVWLGTAAVVLALGGTATAASKITSAQIKDGTIQAKDIKKGAIGAKQLSTEVRLGMEGTTGATGGLGVVVVESPHFDLPPGGFSNEAAVAHCPAGKVVVGTGFYGSIADTGFVKAYATFVGAFMSNDTPVVASDLHVQAICASASGAAATSAGLRNAEYISDRKDAIAAVR